MTNREKLKDSILTAFKEGKSFIAFTDLLSLPHHEVATLLSKNKWLDKPSIAQYFWNDFCLSHPQMVFNGSASQTILNWYLKNFDQISDELNKILVKYYPGEFVKAIKRNRSFLNEDFLKRLCLFTYSWPEDIYSVDLLAWNDLQKSHIALQNEIGTCWHSIKGLKLEIILSGIIHWIEVRFYQENYDLRKEELTWVYNYAMSYIFAKVDQDSFETEEEFIRTFLNTIKSSDNILVGKFLEKIEEWLKFETTYLSSYCFDDNFKPLIKEGILDFDFESQEVYNYWKEESERYQVNEKRYLDDALQIYNYQNERGELNIPSGDSEITKDINHLLYIYNIQADLFLGDLHIRNLKFGTRSVQASNIMVGLKSYAANRKWRYVDPMNRFSKAGYSWGQSLNETIQLALKDKVSNPAFPFMYISKDDLTAIYQNAIPELTKQEIDDLINHFSYVLKPGAKFDPFRYGYSVMLTPFIRIGDFLFTSTSFFASNNWFYSFGQRALILYANKYHKKEQTETAAEMEKDLGKLFEEHDWHVKVCSNSEANAIDGDIDLFINDSETQILIQLKRTKFKINLASNYKDSFETDLKAAGQLNEAVKSLLPDGGIMPNHQKWMVTTSFEGIFTEIDDCLKVNYFDLLWALRNKKYNSLKELKTYIESDGPFKDCRYLLQELN